MNQRKNIVFIDNKQTISSDFRVPRYFLFQSILEKEGFQTNIIFGRFHHGLKKYIDSSENIKKNNIGIKNLSYSRHLSVSRLFSELFFGFQVLFKSFHILKQAKIIVLNDSGIFYNYIFYIIKPICKYKILLDSNDLWPEIFFKKKNIIKDILIFLKFKLYDFSDFFICVNKSYFDYYNKPLKSILHKQVIPLGLTQNIYDKIKSDLFEKDSKRILYLGSFGENYEIEKIVEFAEKNNVFVDFFGTGDKYSFLVKKEITTNGLITVNEPKALENFKFSKNKYLCGLAIYNKNSLVEFPTKVFDYWAFNLPVVTSVGKELIGLFERKPYLGLYTENLNHINFNELQLRFKETKCYDKSEYLVINDIVLSFFKKIYLNEKR